MMAPFNYTIKTIEKDIYRVLGKTLNSKGAERCRLEDLLGKLLDKYELETQQAYPLSNAFHLMSEERRERYMRR